MVSTWYQHGSPVPSSRGSLAHGMSLSRMTFDVYEVRGKCTQCVRVPRQALADADVGGCASVVSVCACACALTTGMRTSTHHRHAHKHSPQAHTHTHNHHHNHNHTHFGTCALVGPQSHTLRRTCSCGAALLVITQGRPGVCTPLEERQPSSLLPAAPFLRLAALPSLACSRARSAFCSAMAERLREKVRLGASSRAQSASLHLAVHLQEKEWLVASSREIQDEANKVCWAPRGAGFWDSVHMSANMHALCTHIRRFDIMFRARCAPQRCREASWATLAAFVRTCGASSYRCQCRAVRVSGCLGGVIPQDAGHCPASCGCVRLFTRMGCTGTLSDGAHTAAHL